MTVTQKCQRLNRQTFEQCGAPATVFYRLGNYCRSCFYREYLDSSQWEGLRERMLRLACNRCQRCRSEGGRGKNGNVTGLNVHHLTYDRLGNEDLKDLIVLCRKCHEAEHGIRG